MKIKIEEGLLKRFNNFETAKYILDFDHTLSREAVSTDCCGITRFRLVLVDEVPKIFDGQIESNIGTIYFKNWGKMYLDENMKLRPLSNGLVEFISDNSVIAQNVQIFDFRNTELVLSA